MKHLKILLITLALSGSACAQSVPSYSPSFAAVVVANLDNASGWYQSTLRLKVKSQQNDSQGNYRVAILTSDNFELELLELKGSLPRSNVLAGKPAGTQIQGHFKMGFSVVNMDVWLEHLKAANVTVPQIWKDSQSGKRNFLITDPEGNLIQFFEK